MRRGARRWRRCGRVLPTPARVAAGDLDGLLLHPLALGEFDAGGTGLGPTLMLGASWDAYKSLAEPADDDTRAAGENASGDPEGPPRRDV